MWDENVERKGGDRKSKNHYRGPVIMISAKTVAGPRQFSVEAAQKLIEFTKQTISKFRIRLQDEDAYRVVLRGPSYRKALNLRGELGMPIALEPGEDVRLRVSLTCRKGGITTFFLALLRPPALAVR